MKKISSVIDRLAKSFAKYVESNDSTDLIKVRDILDGSKCFRSDLESSLKSSFTKIGYPVKVKRVQNGYIYAVVDSKLYIAIGYNNDDQKIRVL